MDQTDEFAASLLIVRQAASSFFRLSLFLLSGTTQPS